MARYNTFRYGSGVKYGASAPDTLVWALEVDWDGDGVFDGSVEKGRILSIPTITRGRNYMVGSTANDLENAVPGRMTIILDNSDGRYNGRNLASPLYPNVGTGRLARVKMRYGSTVYPVFSGVISNLRLDGRSGTAMMTIEDGLLLLQLKTIAGSGGAVFGGSAQKAGVHLDGLLYQAAWPAAWGRSLDDGVAALPWFWTVPEKAYDQVVQVVNSELGIFFADRSGRAVFLDRNHSQTPAHTIVQGEIGIDISTTQPWESSLDAIEITYHQYRNGASGTVVWSSNDDLMLGPSETKTFTAQVTPVVSYYSPVSGTDWTAFSGPGGTGSNQTAVVTMTATPIGAAVFSFTVINASASTVYVNLRQLRGTPILEASYQASASAASPSIFNRSMELDLAWLQDGNTAVSLAGELVKVFQDLGPLPTVTITGRPDLQFDLELFEVILLDVPNEGINARFRIGRIEHRAISPNNQAFATTVGLEPYLDTSTYWIFPVTFNTTSILGY